MNNRNLPPLPTEVTPGTVWRHYKGNRYFVVAVGCIEATCEPCVVYRRTDGTDVWVSPMSDWLGDVNPGQSRFTRVR